MKKIQLIFLCTASLLVAVAQVHAQDADSTGLPGDHFSLQGALEMFKKAASPEEFEQLINEKDNHVNNLDLNEDGEVDYVKVIAKKEKDMHLLVLQVAVSAGENQDIAVIEIEKTGHEEADLQIVGDEDIYGEEIIAEAAGAEDETMSNTPGNGPSASVHEQHGRFVNVWFWPGVRFMYRPSYVGWASPWYWGYRPAWYRPWRPYSWHAYRPLRYRYHHPGVRVVHVHRTVHVHHVYRPQRVTSVTVNQRHATTVNNYRVNRSRTTVTGPQGNTVNRRSTTVTNSRGNGYRKQTTTVRGPGGRVKAQKTTVHQQKRKREK